MIYRLLIKRERERPARVTRWACLSARTGAFPSASQARKIGEANWKKLNLSYEFFFLFIFPIRRGNVQKGNGIAKWRTLNNLNRSIRDAFESSIEITVNYGIANYFTISCFYGSRFREGNINFEKKNISHPNRGVARNWISRQDSIKSLTEK